MSDYSVGETASHRTYWLSLFNPTTWQEFLDAGADVMGFPETRRNTVKRIKPGDYLLGYMTGVSRWVSVLEVISEPYTDTEHQIWKQATFPCRVRVKLITSLTPDMGVPVLSLSKELRLFDNLKSPNWGLLFKTAPRELHREDGQLITKTLQAAVQQAQSVT
jgi:predicted RNA-binding protein